MKIVALGAPAFARRGALLSAIVTIAVFVMTAVSMGFRPDGSEWAFWRPASGVAVGVATCYSPRDAAQIAASAGLGAFLGAAVVGRTLLYCVGSAITAALEAWIASRILQGRTGRVPILEDWVSLRRVFAAAGAVGAVTTVGLGITAALAFGWDQVPAYLLTNVPATVSGVLIVAPLFFASPPSLARLAPLALFLQWSVLAATVIATFRLTVGLPIAFLVIPALIWGAARAPYRHFMIQLIVASLAISVFTANSFGPFGREDLADFAPLLAGTLSVAVAATTFTLIASAARAHILRALLDARAEVYQESIEASVIGVGVVSDVNGALQLSDVNAAGRLILGLQNDQPMSIQRAFVDDSTLILRAAMRGLSPDQSESWSGPVIELRSGRLLRPSLVPLSGFSGLTKPIGRSERRASLQFMDVTARERERTQQEAELRRASDIQAALTPAIDITIPPYHFAARSISTRGIGGDFYDCRAIDNGVVATLGDVMGKGIGPALVASGLKMALRLENAGHPPASALARVAQSTESDLNDASIFATVFIARVNTADGSVRYVDAGHGLAVICGGDAQPVQLLSRGLPLGVLVDSSWTERTAHLGPGETLVIFSDGILELFDGSLTVFDEIARLSTASRSADDLIEKLFSSADRDALIDDVTAIVIRRDAAS